MADKRPRPNDPLSPYYPSEVPTLAGNGRQWFAILIPGLWLSLGVILLVVELSPGTAETVSLFTLLGALVGGWVYRDAKACGSNWTWQWAIGLTVLFGAGLLPGLVPLAYYFSARGEDPR